MLPAWFLCMLFDWLQFGFMQRLLAAGRSTQTRALLDRLRVAREEVLAALAVLRSRGIVVPGFLSNQRHIGLLAWDRWNFPEPFHLFSRLFGVRMDFALGFDEAHCAFAV